MDHKHVIVEHGSSERRSGCSTGVTWVFFFLGILVGIGLLLTVQSLKIEKHLRNHNRLRILFMGNTQDASKDSEALDLCRNTTNGLKEALSTCQTVSEGLTGEVFTKNYEIRHYEEIHDKYVDQIEDLENKLSANEKLLEDRKLEVEQLRKNLVDNEENQNNDNAKTKELREQIVAGENQLKMRDREIEALQDLQVETTERVTNLEAELASLKEQPSPPDLSKKCTPGWSYLAHTDSCYYYHNFTLDDSDEMIKFSWTTAEKNCQQWGAHLLSVHSKTENQFIKDMIITNLQLLHPEKKTSNFCMNFEDHVWTGLRRVNGKSTHADGSSTTDYIRTSSQDEQGSMCYEFNHGDIYGMYGNHNFATKQPRFICKKAANP